MTLLRRGLRALGLAPFNDLQRAEAEIRTLRTEVDGGADPHRVDRTLTVDELERASAVMALGAEGVGAWAWDLQSGELFWSSYLEAMHGMEPGDFDGTFAMFASTVHPDDRPGVTDDVETAAESGRDLQNFYRYLRRDGSVGWLRGMGRVMRDGDDEPVAMVGLAIDESALVEQREELRAQRDRMAELMQERSTLRRMLDQILLPGPLANPPGLDVDAAYRAAGAEATGDFYDLFPTGQPGEWVLAVGDIAGHGPEAAVLTGSVRQSLHSASLLTSDPAAILAAANEVHRATSTDYRFATANVVVMREIDDAAMHVELATAGHPAALVRRRDGRIEPLVGAGPPLGVLESPEFEAVTTDLDRGEMLVVYTDGVIEAGVTTPAGDFGRDRVADWLSGLGGTVPLPGSAAGLLDLVERHDPSRRDDAACVVVRVTPR